MRTALKPREGVYELYWRFASRRQAAFEARLAGESWPWSDDRILQEYKFTNVYRAADRVSQDLIRNVCYSPQDDAPADRVFQVVAYRTFSNIKTWQAVTAFLGHAPLVEDLRSGAFSRALEVAQQVNGKLYTGAFILCASDAYGMGKKYLNHVELFRDMFVRNRLADAVLDAPSLRSIYNLLHEFPLMGDFMSYQTAVDLNYTDLVNFSENDFTQAGPGAVRGIRKVFADTGNYSPADIIHWMVDHQASEFDRFGLPFNGLWGRPIHAIDAQNLFCETDKYCREAAPALASNRSRIKARFSPTNEPISYFFPPKWGLTPADRESSRSPSLAFA